MYIYIDIERTEYRCKTLKTCNMSSAGSIEKVTKELEVTLVLKRAADK